MSDGTLSLTLERPVVPDQTHERLALEPKACLAKESFSDPIDQNVLFIPEEEEPRIAVPVT